MTQGINRGLRNVKAGLKHVFALLPFTDDATAHASLYMSDLSKLVCVIFSE